jgi:hypothetical protein
VVIPGRQGYALAPKSSSWIMRAVGAVLSWCGVDFSRFWTTIRLPWCAVAVVYHPDDIEDPKADRWALIRAHEAIHVAQLRPWWGPYVMAAGYVLLPFPVLLSGRWLIERRAYLGDIRSGALTVDRAVDVLWRSYLYPWPRRWMRRWFHKQIARSLR